MQMAAEKAMRTLRNVICGLLRSRINIQVLLLLKCVFVLLVLSIYTVTRESIVIYIHSIKFL